MKNPTPKELLVEKTPSAWVLSLRGAHDLTAAPALRKQLEDAHLDGRSIVVDFSAATFIDSSVLGAVLAGWNTAAMQPQHELVVCAPRGSAARQLLGYVGLVNELRVFEDVDAATAYLAGSYDTGAGTGG